MNDRLAELFAAKAIASDADEARESLEVVTQRGLARRDERRPFRSALQRGSHLACIAEIKRASPSVGIIEPNFDPAKIASDYETAQVDALSVLTEASGFLGELRYLDVVRSRTTRPILRKDFLSRPYEIAQSAAYGADAILLIVAGLSNEQLAQLLAQARRFSLDALVEIHDEAELQRALSAGADIIGINNRDLRSFTVNLAVTEQLAPLVPAHCICVSESGLKDSTDLLRVQRAGAGAVLIGEAFMRSADRHALMKQVRESHVHE